MTRLKEQIFRLIKAGKEEYDEEIRDFPEWDFFYHLSRLRKAALSWYPIPEHAKVLEAGCGFGALTGVLCEKAAYVDAVDPDPVFAEGCRKRYQDRDNLNVICSDLMSFVPDHSYDLIVAVELFEGLEVSPSRLIGHLKKMLTSDGVLLLGFRNRFGLKYSCGIIDEYVRRPGEALLPSVKLHTQEEIRNIVSGCGFEAVRTFYPMPDFGFTQTVYTEEWMPEESIRDRIITYDPFHEGDSDNPYLDNGVFDSAIREGMLGKTANVILLECRMRPVPEKKIIRAILSDDREKEHAFQTVFYDDQTVVKSPVCTEGIQTLEKLYENIECLSKAGVTTVLQELSGNQIIMPLVKERPLLEYIRELIDKDPSAIIEVYRLLEKEILKSSPEVQEENIELPDPEGVKLKTGYIDMIPYNAFWMNGKILFYDQEFTVSPCPVKYILYRAIRYTWLHLPELEDKLPIREMKKQFSISEEQWEIFNRYEDAFTARNRNRDLYRQFYQWANYRKPYHIGLVMGVFDLFHSGHLNLLRRAKEKCDYLRVGVLCNELVYKYKKILPTISLEDRMEILRAIRYVDDVVLIDDEDVSRIKEWHRRPFDCFFSGDDHVGNEYWQYEKQELEKLGSTIEFFSYTEGISSTMIRKAIEGNH